MKKTLVFVLMLIALLVGCSDNQFPTTIERDITVVVVNHYHDGTVMVDFQGDRLWLTKEDAQTYEFQVGKTYYVKYYTQSGHTTIYDYKKIDNPCQ